MGECFATTDDASPLRSAEGHDRVAGDQRPPIPNPTPDMSMRGPRELASLLMNLYDVGSLRRWLVDVMPELRDHLPEGGAVTRYVFTFDAVSELTRRNALDGAFFARLVQQHPGRTVEIGSIAEGFGVTFPQAEGGAAPPAAGDDYDATWVVERNDIERNLQESLHHSRSVLLVGPRRHGKTFLTRAIIDRHVHPDDHIIWIGFRTWDEQDLDNGAAFAPEFARRIAQQLGPLAPPLGAVERATEQDWPKALGTYLSGALGRLTSGRLILLLDDAQQLSPHRTTHGAFFAMLRGWAERRKDPGWPTWHRLQLTVTLSTHLGAMATSEYGSMFVNAVHRIPVRGLALPELASMARMHGQPEEPCETLHAYIGGNPFLARLALFESRRANIDVGTLCSDTAHRNRVFGEFVHMAKRELQREHLLEPLLGLATAHRPPSLEDGYALWAAGFLDDARQGLRCRLYEDIIR